MTDGLINPQFKLATFSYTIEHAMDATKSMIPGGEPILCVKLSQKTNLLHFYCILNHIFYCYFYRSFFKLILKSPTEQWQIKNTKKKKKENSGNKVLHCKCLTKLNDCRTII